MKIDFKLVPAADIERAKELFRERLPYEDIPDPDWNALWGRYEDGVLTDFVGLQYRIVVEPGVFSSVRGAREMSIWVDGALNGKDYEFVVDDRNEIFGRMVVEHYGFEPEPQMPHRLFVRRRTNG